VSSNNLTVAIKGKDGNNLSASNPGYVMINGTWRIITGALSVTANAGSNLFNAGSAELATKEIDYFAYLGYNATDGVVLGFARIPFAKSYDDFSTTSPNEKYCKISTITNAVATDYYENIGRFGATLSAGAGYTWTVPTFTAKNLIQRPIYETRFLEWYPTFSGSDSMTVGVNTRIQSYYQIINDRISVYVTSELTCGGSLSWGVLATYPFMRKTVSQATGSGSAQNSGGYQLFFSDISGTERIGWRKYDGGNHGAGTFGYFGNITYSI
jgi:hypothetical protein